ncbi:unnamed protein product [Lactuca virosa]|uniref:Uncharacterized protein n=1 Tax=Lactuca virosa TaxID=75947 RepID=A0AAU9LPA8_9ASTR|nr:unnamed protein product [Lactuca virosa]
MEDPKSLSVVAVFQQKLFGSGFGCFLVLTTNSSIVTPMHILSDTMTENEEPVGTESVDMEASIPSPPTSSGRMFLFFLYRFFLPFLFFYMLFGSLLQFSYLLIVQPLS